MRPSVLHICLSTGHGGLELYPGRVLPALSRRGWDVSLLALDGSLAAETARHRGVSLWTKGSRRGAMLDALALARQIRECRIELVHCHKSSDLRLAVLLQLLVPKLIIVFTEHMGASKPKTDLYHRWAYSKVSRIFSISEDTLARNKVAFPYAADRLRRLYLGIDLSDYQEPLSEAAKSVLREELKLPHRALLITLPGRLSPGKGHKVWLEALAKLPAEPTAERWHGVVVGETKGNDGHDTEYSRSLRAYAAQLGLSDKITFTGYRSDLPAILQLSDIVVVPSVREAFGLTVIEAMAAGKPVIGSDAGAIPELISPDSGVTFPANSYDALSAEMLRLISDRSLRNNFAHNGYRRATESFSMEAHVSGLENEYSSLIDSR